MEAILVAGVIAATPILLGMLGELITEKAGHLNLGVEGMMMMGAVISFKVGYVTSNPALAVVGALLAGAFGAAIYAVLTISLKTNQVVTGLTLTIFGTSFASFVGKSVSGVALSSEVRHAFDPIAIPVLSDLPLIGHAFFNQDIIVYITYLITVAIAFYLNKTKVGLNTRAVGENAAAADASGIAVDRYKYFNVIIGGSICALGGAYMTLAIIPVWQENIVAGRGWIAVALVIFASWKPVKAAIGALVFGLLSILGYRLQAQGIAISQYLVDMIPYLATVVIVILSTRKNRKEDMPPGNLGDAYFREDR